MTGSSVRRADTVTVPKMPVSGSTTVHLHTSHTVGEVDPRIFGGFLEHMGRAVYGGIFDPPSPLADEHGCRADVLEALGGLDMTVMRYPGGNFASGYHWQDGIGGERPVVRDLAWRSTETNAFGTHEFCDLCERMGWQPMLTVNLGTGTPEEALAWVEYCNAPAGTRWGDLRAANGRREPWGVRLWCLGNEMDGPWQMGHVPAEEYALRAHQTAKLMKATDPAIRTVACGSSGPQMPTYITWDRTVLAHLGGLADLVSLHRYAGDPVGDLLDYLAVTNSIDRQIEEIDATARQVRAERKGGKRAYLSFDEWNVWYRTMTPGWADGGWEVAPPIIEEVYDLADALAVAGFLHSFVRHADVVKVANLAQICNVIAPVLTRPDGLLVQSIYHPFAMFSSRRDGDSLRVAVEGPAYEAATHGRVTEVDVSAILGADRLHVFCTNRSPDRTASLLVELGGPGSEMVEVIDAEILTGPSPEAANTWEAPDVLRREPFDGLSVTSGRLTGELPPLSFLAATLRLDR
jgi:alpha-L-arabinofuranosidase